ncbi:GGDEF domain-containing protein [Paenisporosarcina antarctica]|uniref:GGDEF domain-containing protein n=1 Tax=Paenisporosarcina antarctica TaxID=417367 RepID=A0A4P6ZUT6_9BACL|nr:GGDEF domain-containing protein [Paenisporosarcina antarctica]QBP39729.1 GGDEF domain-containing protein [Paenisporosarcina antarctica]
MKKYKIFDVFLFVASIIIGFSFAPLDIDLKKYILVVTIYLVFSAMYSNQKILQEKGSLSFDYGISYSQSFALFAGPFGLLLFEIVNRFTTYFQRKVAKTADEDEFTDTLYNIGSFTLYHTVGFIFFFSLYPYAQMIPFGFFLLFFLTALLISFQGNILMLLSFYFSGNLHSWSEVVVFIKGRSILDIAKVALTNALLYYFVMENQWEMLIILFTLNFMVSRSFVSKQESVKNELERDRFREMAYSDFMTGLSNRAMMDKKMREINGTGELLAIVVADIDKFKRINDNYNHSVGDYVIEHFAGMLKSHTGKEDLVFRSGGEEFTLFLRGRGYEECVELLESLRLNVSDHPVEVEFNGVETSISYSASFGLYFNEMSEDLPMERAYNYADQLLFEAKELGRDRLVVRNGQQSLVYS